MPPKKSGNKRPGPTSRSARPGKPRGPKKFSGGESSRPPRPNRAGAKPGARAKPTTSFKPAGSSKPVGSSRSVGGLKPISSPAPTPRKPKSDASSVQGIRLQKVLASAGLGSRRQCEELITTGRVEIDRNVVTELGTRVHPDRCEIRVDGQALHRSKLAYFAVNKPCGVVCTNRDPSGRPRVTDMIGLPDLRLFTIGRLDLNSEGLILVTNDGELANHLAHPRYGVQKIYRVQVAGLPDPEMLLKLRRGVHLAECTVRVDDVKIKSRHKESTIMEIALREGKNREIRRILARFGHKVLTLVRIAVGPIRLGEMARGEVRRLTNEEIASLKKLIPGNVS